jgi:hypothetical protein
MDRFARRTLVHSLAYVSSRRIEIANKMRLYQHTARCPAALRWFLASNPDYWCFIPLLWQEAQADNIAYFLERSVARRNIADVDFMSIIAITSTSSQRVAFWLDRVPLPPAAYAFSYEQRRQQRAFFERFLASPVDQTPYSPVDSYKAAIIAVRKCTISIFIGREHYLSTRLFLVPNERSMLLKYLVETLFSIHGETKLNMICPVGGGCSQTHYGLPYDRVWCVNLNRPLVATPASRR